MKENKNDCSIGFLKTCSVPINRKTMGFPDDNFEFQVWDDGNSHGVYKVTGPGGLLSLDIGMCDGIEMDQARAFWVASVLNEALTKLK
jgi:hypothetical protein